MGNVKIKRHPFDMAKMLIHQIKKTQKISLLCHLLFVQNGLPTSAKEFRITYSMIFKFFQLI